MRGLPGYREVRELGSGAQGRVVLAVEERSGRQVAVKYLRGASAAGLAVFRSEAELLGRVESPHVAALYGFREAGDAAAIVMEAVDGASLRGVLDAHAPLAPEAALTVLKGSLLGLEAAHRAGVVHRDYKPANVIVTESGRSKLVDFGVAVLTGDHGGSGTPAYMAPEQWDRGEATPATDVYAATCVFFECVMGEKPFQGASLPVLAELHRSAPVPVEPVPEPLRDLVTRGMAKTPGDRPSSARGFVRELEAAAVRAYGPDWEAHGWAVLGGIAAGFLGGVAVSAAVGTTAVTATTTASSGVGTAATSTAAISIASAVIGVAVTGGAGVYVVKKFRDDPRPAAVAAAAPSLAYATSSAVVVADGTGRTRNVASVPRGDVVTSLGWSADGKTIGWATEKADYSAGRGIHLAPASGGPVRSWPCPETYCGNPVFWAEGFVVNTVAPKRRPELLIYPAGGGEPRRLRVTGLPRDTFLGTYGVPDVEAATPEGVIISHGVGTSAYGGPVTYYRVTPSGQAVKLFLDEHNVAPHDTWPSPDGRKLIYTSASRGGYCAHYEDVNIADLATGEVDSPKMPRNYVTVAGTWYDRSGVLHGSFLPQPKSCTTPGAEDVDVPPTVYALRSGKWVATGERTLSAASAPGSSTASLSGLRGEPGTLTVTREGRTVTTEKVVTYAWSPK